MERVVVRTRLKAGREAEYDRVHAAIPADLERALRACGVRSWRIWRDGLDLFHVVEVDDYRTMRQSLADDPVNVRWQATMAELLDVVDDYSGTDTGIPLVWQLD